jgi:uncharacterized membrane protein YccC
MIPMSRSTPDRFARFKTFLLSHFEAETRTLQLELGVRGALALVVPIGLGLLFQQLAHGLIVGLSAFMVLNTDAGGAYRQKAITMVGATVGVTLALVAGVAATSSQWAQAVGTFICLFGSALFSVYGNAPSLIGFMTANVFIVAEALSDWDHLFYNVLLCLTGASWALFLSLALWPLRAFSPVFRAVSESYLKLSMLLDVLARDAASEKRSNLPFALAYDDFVGALEKARTVWAAVRSKRSGPSARSAHLLDLIEDANQIGASIVAAREFLNFASFSAPEVRADIADAASALARTAQKFSTAIARRNALDLYDLRLTLQTIEERLQSRRAYREPSDLSSVGQTRKLVRAMRTVAEHLENDVTNLADLGDRRPPRPPSESSRDLVRPSRLWAGFSSNLTFRSTGFRHALRLGLIASLATLLASTLHLGRGYWIGLTVLVVLKPNFGGTIQRAVQRVIGTIVGAVLAGAISFTVRDPWLLLFCLTLLAFITFAIKTVNYGLFVISLTPLIMVILDIVHPGAWYITLIRVLYTVIGGIMAVAGGYLLFPIWESTQLPAQLARTLKAESEFFAVVMGYRKRVPGQDKALSEKRRTASLEVMNAATATQRLIAEPPHVRGAVEPTLTLINYAREFFQSVASLAEYCRHAKPEEVAMDLDGFSGAVTNTLNNLSEALTSGTSLLPLPDLDGMLENVQFRPAPNYDALSTGGYQETNTAVSSTLTQVQGETAIRGELERISSDVRIMHEAVSRLREPAPGSVGDNVLVGSHRNSI